MIPGNLNHRLEVIVGPDHLLTTPEEHWGYAYDATDRAAMPDAVVFPGSAAEVAAMVRLANEHRFPVVPRGAGTGRSGGSAPLGAGGPLSGRTLAFPPGSDKIIVFRSTRKGDF